MRTKLTSVGTVAWRALFGLGSSRKTGEYGVDSVDVNRKHRRLKWRLDAMFNSKKVQSFGFLGKFISIKNKILSPCLYCLILGLLAQKTNGIDERPLKNPDTPLVEVGNGMPPTIPVCLDGPTGTTNSTEGIAPSRKPLGDYSDQKPNQPSANSERDREVAHDGLMKSMLVGTIIFAALLGLFVVWVESGWFYFQPNAEVRPPARKKGDTQ